MFLQKSWRLVGKSTVESPLLRNLRLRCEVVSPNNSPPIEIGHIVSEW